MKVGDRVKCYGPGARLVHRVSRPVGKPIFGDFVAGCGQQLNSGCDHLLPPDTPVTCKRCLAAMERDQK